MINKDKKHLHTRHENKNKNAKTRIINLEPFLFLFAAMPLFAPRFWRSFRQQSSHQGFNKITVTNLYIIFVISELILKKNPETSMKNPKLKQALLAS